MAIETIDDDGGGTGGGGTVNPNGMVVQAAEKKKGKWSSLRMWTLSEVKMVEGPGTILTDLPVGTMSNRSVKLMKVKRGKMPPFRAEPQTPFERKVYEYLEHLRWRIDLEFDADRSLLDNLADAAFNYYRRTTRPVLDDGTWCIWYDTTAGKRYFLANVDGEYWGVELFLV